MSEHQQVAAKSPKVGWGKRWQDWDRVLCWILLVAAVAMVIHIFSQYLAIHVWRHDNLPYQENYVKNLKEEGRWINYFLFGLLQALPSTPTALFNLFCVGFFSYRIADRFTADRRIGLFFACTVLIFPLFHLQNLWPNVLPVAALFLAVTPWLKERYSAAIFFLVSSIVFFGTQSHFYFLMPLLFLPDLADEGKSLSDRLIFFLKNVLAPWLLFFVVGYMVANGIVYAKYGSFIELAAWRRPHPVHSMSDLWTNILSVTRRMTGILSEFFTSSYHLLIPVLIIGLVRRNFLLGVVGLMSFLAPFYSTVFHGIIISDRTLFVATIPLLAIAFLFWYRQVHLKSLIMGLGLVIVFPFYQQSMDQLEWFGKTTDFYRTELSNALYGLSLDKEQSGVVFLVDVSEIRDLNRQLKEHYGLSFQWGEPLHENTRTVVAGAKSLGYKRVWSMKIPDNVKELIQQYRTQGVPEVFRVIPLQDGSNAYGVFLNQTDIKESLD